MTRLAASGIAAHVFFELGAGVGMPFASLLGPAPAAALWAVGTRSVFRAAATRPASSDDALAIVNGACLAAVIAHLCGWPTRRTRLGLPWLEDCEGLGPQLMPIYNPIIYFSGVTALIAILAENRTASRRVPLLLAAALAPVLVWAQHGEFRRLTRLARSRRGWWNRRLQQSLQSPPPQSCAPGRTAFLPVVREQADRSVERESR